MYKVNKLYLKEYWDIPIEYHPTISGKIIINIPGADGSVKGYMNKYVNLGDHIQDKGFASFVRVPNDRPQEFLNTGRCIVNYCLEHSKEICGFTSTFIDCVGKLRIVLSLTLYNAIGDLESIEAERTYTVVK